MLACSLQLLCARSIEVGDNDSNMRFSSGDRVRVAESYSWAKGAVGTVELPPEAVRALVEEYHPYDGCTRTVPTLHGPEEQVWVSFDEPQIDADGDGPYRGAEIPTNMLEAFSPRS